MLPPQRQPEAPRRRGGWFAARTGAAPARSALGLRLALALFGLVFCGVAAGLFAVGGWQVPAALLALAAAIALADLVVIGVRLRQRRRRHPAWRPRPGSGADRRRF
jgi:hypothetical protein